MDLTILDYSSKRRKKGVRKSYTNNDGEIYLDCFSCNNIKHLNEFPTRKAGFHGKDANCKACKSGYNKKYREENKEELYNNLKEWRAENWDKVLESNRQWYDRNREERGEQIKEYRKNNKEWLDNYNKEYYSIPENRDRRTKRRRRHYVENREHQRELAKIWRINNLERFNAYHHTYKARKKGLPDELTNVEELLEIQEGECVLSGSYIVDLEHFLPLEWGHGGTTFENCYYMDSSLNRSKRNANPFEWVRTYSEEIQDYFYNDLVPMMAYRNGLTVDEFKDFVYWCEANKRTVEETEADNIKYGYKKPSIEVWKESTLVNV